MVNHKSNIASGNIKNIIVIAVSNNISRHHVIEVHKAHDYFYMKKNKTTCRLSMFIYLIDGFCIAFEGLHVNDIVMAYLTPSTNLSTK